MGGPVPLQMLPCDLPSTKVFFARDVATLTLHESLGSCVKPLAKDRRCQVGLRCLQVCGGAFTLVLLDARRA